MVCNPSLKAWTEAILTIRPDAGLGQTNSSDDSKS